MLSIEKTYEKNSHAGQMKSGVFSWIAETISKHWGFILYGLIGVLNTGVHFIVFMGVYQIIDSQTISNFIAFCAAVVFSFFMNAKFTFQKRPTAKMFVKMFFVMSLLSLGAGYVGDLFTVHPLITFVGYCAFSYLVGFVLSKTFVYKD